MGVTTLINGISSKQIQPEDRNRAIVAGKLIFLNKDMEAKQVMVDEKGATHIQLGSGDLEVQLKQGENGKTKAYFYQDPMDRSAPLESFTLELSTRNGEKQNISFDFKPENKIEEDAPGNPFQKHSVVANSYMQEVDIAPGIYSVKAISAEAKNIEAAKPQLGIYDPNAAKDTNEQVARGLAAKQDRRAA